MTSLERLRGLTDLQKRELLGDYCVWGIATAIHSSRGQLKPLEKACDEDCGNHPCANNSIKEYLEQYYFRAKD